MDAITRATTRLYITSSLIRAMPSVTQFAINKENYDDAVFEFITELMKVGLKFDGRTWTGKASNEYYYKFLEQVVNGVHRKVISGIINPEIDFTEEEKEAYKVITDTVLNFYKEYEGELESLSTTSIMQQSYLARALSNKAASSIAGLGMGSSDFDKDRAESAKKEALETTLFKTEEYALVFLKRLIREEFIAAGEDWNSRLFPPIENVDHLFLLSDTWIRGGINSDGPLDVMSNPKSPSGYNIPSGTPSSLQNAINDLQSNSRVAEFAESLKKAFDGMDDWPFVLEKYIRVFEKDSPPSEMDRAENLYNIVNLNDWQEFVL
jgi:hypothetical protein